MSEVYQLTLTREEMQAITVMVTATIVAINKIPVGADERASINAVLHQTMPWHKSVLEKVEKIAATIE